MKYTTKTGLVFILATIVTFVLMGFNTPTQSKKLPLVVERQECVLQHMVGFIPSHDIDIGMAIDVPVSGDKTVVDSIMRFINEAVYSFMESGDDSGFTPEQVYCADAKHLVKHYYDAYKPLIADTCYEAEGTPGCLCEPEYFSVTMLGQTDTFVTYEISTLYLGEGATYFREWFTFHKDDGHQAQSVITMDGLLRFFNEHPEERNELYGMMEDFMKYGEDVEGRSTFGLSGDKVMHQFRIPGDAYDAEYDLEVIKPYLTDEVKELLEKSNL